MPDAATASMDVVGKAGSELQHTGGVVEGASGDDIATTMGAVAVAGMAVQPAGAGTPSAAAVGGVHTRKPDFRHLGFALFTC